MPRVTGAPGRGLLAWLTAALAVGPLVTYGLGAMGVDIMADTGIGTAELGVVTATIFLGSAVLSFVQGATSRSLPPVATMSLLFGGVAASMVLLATATGFPAMVLAALVYAAVLTLGQTGTNTIIADHVPPARRGFWIGIKQSGTPLGLLVAGAVYPALADAIGWRLSFAASAATAVAVLLAGLPALSRLPVPPAPRTGPDAAATPARLPRHVAGYAAILLAFGIGASAGNLFLPIFAHDVLGLSTVAAGATMIVSAIVSIASRILIGRWLTSWRRRRVALLVLAAGAASGSLLLLASGWTGLTALLWVGAALHGGFAVTALVVVTAGIIDEVPTGMLARATGVVSGGNFVGYALGPVLVGSLAPTPAGLTSGWALTTAAFALAVAIVAALRAPTAAAAR